MAQSNRNAQENINSSTISSPSRSPSQHNVENEMRIQIDDFDEAQQLSNEEAVAPVQQNISSILHHARNEFERHTEQARVWGAQLNTILRDVRWPPPASHVLRNELNSQEAARHAQPTPGSYLNENQNGINSSTSNSHTGPLNSAPRRPESNSITNMNDPAPSISISIGANPIEHLRSQTRSDNQPTNARSAREPVVPNNNSVEIQRRPELDDTALTEMLAQVPEVRHFIQALLRYIPFMFIVLVKSILDDFMAVSYMLSTSGLFYMMDSSLQSQVARRSQPRTLIFLRDVIFTTILLLYWMKECKNDHNLWMIRDVEQPTSIGSLLYTVWITDHMLKLMTILIKHVIAILPTKVIRNSRKGRFYMLIESTSQLYRYLVTIQPWLTYMTAAYVTGIKVICGLVYMTPKLMFMMERLVFFKKAVSMFPRSVKYGTIPTKKDLEKSGDQCPICHDRFNTPVLLTCKHIFCENCIGSWFRSETTCPMCRAKVVEDMSWLDGRTTQFVQFF